MRYLFVLFGFLILFSDCKKEEDLLVDQIIGSWRLAEVIAYDRENNDVDKTVKSMLGNQLISNGYVLHFFPDSSFTEIDGYKANLGKWASLNNQMIRTKHFNLTIKEFQKSTSREFLILDINHRGENLKSTLKFVKEGKSLEDFTTDPFYPDHNLWRIPPEEKESEEEIQQRLLNYILHYAYILKASEEREHQTVSFSHSLGLIQVFRGGIGRVPKNRIKQEWINCFYDEDDAMKAYALFSSYLKKGVYKGGTTGNWVKDDFEILLHIYQQIKTNENQQI